MTIIKSDLPYGFKRTDSGKIKIKVWGKTQIVMLTTFLSLFVLTVYGFLTFDYKGISIVQATVDTLYNLKVMFLQPAFSHFALMDAVVQVGLTLGLGFLSTLLGAVLSLFIALFAAKNLSTKPSRTQSSLS